MTEDMYLRIRQVKVRTGLSRATIYNMMKKGSFPMKTALGVRAVGWLESEIAQWMASRKDVTKTGRELKPGKGKKRQGKEQVSVEASPGRENPRASKQAPLGGRTAAVSLLEGWEDDSPALSNDEMEQSRARRLESNRKSTPPATNVSRTAKSILINPAGGLGEVVETRSLALKSK